MELLSSRTSLNIELKTARRFSKIIFLLCPEKLMANVLEKRLISQREQYSECSLMGELLMFQKNHDPIVFPHITEIH